MFTIETGVPIPAKTQPAPKTPRVSKFPFAEMEVGASFIVPATDKVVSARSAVSMWNKKNAPKHMVTRKMDDGSLRVWRRD